MKKIFILTLLCTILLSGCNYQNKENIADVTAPETTSVETVPPATVATNAPATETTFASDSPEENNGIIIVIDPGHGKSSSLMTDSEKINYGYTYIEGKGWGEWRHFKSGTSWNDCKGSECSGRVPSNGSCWYPIYHGDRDTEPELNYKNALNAKKYLEQMGYTVRITRSENENPSLTHRLKYCYPDCNTTKQPDANAYICLHSNAGGGKGSCFIALSGLYDQVKTSQNYIEASNELGKDINDSIIQSTSLYAYGNGRYDGYPELVLFCKSPVPVAYLEIGFYDNHDDLKILQNESNSIGKAIAEGIDSYFSDKN